MTVTVVCPVHNRGPAIAQTVASVLDQRVVDLELVVVLDGCTDDTATHLPRDPRLRVLRTAGFGHPAEPRNLGIAAGTGEIVAYIDHDDRWLPDHLSSLVRLIDGGADLAVTGAFRIDPAGRDVGSTCPTELCWHPEMAVLAPTFEPSRVAHRRDLLRRVGGWRAGPGLEDWDLWVRVADAGARVATSTRRTAVLTQHRDSRRFATARPHRIRLAAFPTAAAARTCMRDLAARDRDGSAGAAAERDALRLFDRLCATDQFVVPVGDDGSPVRPAGGWRAEIRAAAGRSVARRPWHADLELTARAADGFLLEWVLWCPTAEHAQRVRELARRALVSQMDLVRCAVLAAGGRWAWSGRASGGRPVR